MIAVVGVGLEGMASVSPRGRRLLEGAEVVIGTRRHLDLAPGCGRARVSWDGRVESLDAILAGHPGAVLLASGDPNLFGIGATLVERLGPERVDLEPSVSSLQLALARARVPAAGALLVSAHGRPLARAAGLAAGARRAAILTDPASPPDAVVGALAAAGVELEARVVVCERLGGPEERVREGSVGAPPAGPFDPLSVVVLERRAAPGPRLGRPEDEYEHEAGQVTKAELRALAVASLDPGPEDVVWDVGAGSASVAIEAARLASRGSVYAVEGRPERAEQARHNAAGSWNLEVVEGWAPEALGALPAPDAVFVGGGGEKVGEIVAVCAGRLRERSSPFPGRLVANLATLDSVQEAVAALRRLGLRWRLSQVSVSRARDLSGRIGWEALNPVHILAAEVVR